MKISSGVDFRRVRCKQVLANSSLTRITITKRVSWKRVPIHHAEGDWCTINMFWAKHPDSGVESHVLSSPTETLFLGLSFSVDPKSWTIM